MSDESIIGVEQQGTEPTTTAQVKEKKVRTPKTKNGKTAPNKAKASKPKATKAAPSKNGLSLLDAAAKVLKEKRGKSMSAGEITEAVISRKLWAPGTGKTPAATLSSAILRETTSKGKEARFKKVSPGQYVLKG